MPKRYIIFKWVVYGFATLLLVLGQLFLLNQLELWGLFPFLPPMLVGAVASFEGSKASPVFALVFGLLYFYIELPPLNFHAEEFYIFVFLLCLVYCGCAVLTSGFQGEGVKGYVGFVRKQCAVPFFVFIALIAAIAIGSSKIGYSGKLVKERKANGQIPVELRLDDKAQSVINGTSAGDTDFDTEFLDYILAVKCVSGVDEAVAHISAHSTGHSEAIISNDDNAILKFTSGVDSAAVYVNASTRFTDGGEFGLGCEMGISTQKLHARGPMGLKEMTTYKYKIYGNGQVR